MQKLSQIRLFDQLPEPERRWLTDLAETYALSLQQLRQLSEYSIDLNCWEAGSLKDFYHPETYEKTTGKTAAAKVFQQIKAGYDTLKNSRKEYSKVTGLDVREQKFPDRQMKEVPIKGAIMGRCPVASDKTRCCNLNTLDAVQQCGFDCSYCSIQSFYHGNQVRFIRDLPAHLEALELDDHRRYHIGTGQSSDSLMWGNRFGLLDTLCAFAEAHPNVILEMKSKSARIDYFLNRRPPSNMVFTWSLNTPMVIQAEEKGTAPLGKRLQSARKLADMGIPVGFHFHPMVWYRGWEKDYTRLAHRLQAMFDPREVVMISLGTLTFIKPVLKKIRERMARTSILQMPMEEIAGKLSYPFEIKAQLFSTLYQAFSTAWQEEVFFYMCMEDVRLWPLVFGRCYETNEDFEAAMITAYHLKIEEIRERKTAAC